MPISLATWDAEGKASRSMWSLRQEHRHPRSSLSPLQLSDSHSELIFSLPVSSHDSLMLYKFFCLLTSFREKRITIFKALPAGKWSWDTYPANGQFCWMSQVRFRTEEPFGNHHLLNFILEQKKEITAQTAPAVAVPLFMLTHYDPFPCLFSMLSGQRCPAISNWHSGSDV
jgi:hypothetical protein